MAMVNLDWRNSEDRRGIAASLVDIAYLLEKDTDKEQANKWCRQLQFEINKTFTDDHDGSIFAVAFQWLGESRPSENGPPSRVVAFRGTLLKKRTIVKDLFLDLKIFLGCLNSSSSRISKGQQGSQNLCIAGHSLGASIALMVGKSLVIQQGRMLEAHLFNPPFVSHWPRKLCSKYPKLKQLIMDLKDCKRSEKMVNDFIAVKDWMPNVYVNEKDLICSHYIRYFEEWKRVCDNANEVSKFRQYLLCFEAIPCAKLVQVQRSGVFRIFHNHHAVKQWYLKSEDIHFKTTEYVPPAEALAGIGQVRALPLPAYAAPDDDESTLDPQVLNLLGLQISTGL